MHLISAQLFMILILFFQMSSASQLEVAHWIPWSMVEAELGASLRGLPLQKDAVKLTWGEWQPQVRSLKLEMPQDQLKLHVHQGGVDVALGQSSMVPMVLHVGQFEIDQTVVKEWNGNQISIRIQVLCEPFKIANDAMSFALSTSFEKDGAFFSPRVDRFALDYRGEFQVSSIRCSGPQGLDQRASEMLLQSLRDKVLLQSILKDLLDSELRSFISKQWAKLLQSQGAGNELLSFSTPSPGGFYVTTSSNVPGLEASPSLIALDHRLIDSPPTQRQTEVSTHISQSQMQMLISLFISTFKQESFNLQSIPAFANFMRNRFMQLFVWSDLLHYSRKAPFFLHSERSKSIGVSYAPHQVNAPSWIAQYVVQGHIESQRKSKSWRFLEWSMGLSSQMSASIKDAKIVVNASTATSRLNWQYGKEYERQFAPGRPSDKIVRTAINQAVANREFSITLPQIRLGGAEPYRAGELSADQNRVWINWQAPR
jgi:hypothetical protein